MKLVIVTGATKGLGLSLSKRLLKDGYRVVGISRMLSDEYSELMKTTDNALFYPFDFYNVDEIRSLVKKITKENSHIYGLINNAALGHDGILATMHEKEIDELMRVNIQAPILMSKYCSRSMLMKQEGKIINISSIIASSGFNGLSVYAASKAALSGFTKSLARELGKANITVNTVAPGFLQTDMTQNLDAEKLDTIKRRSPLSKLASSDDVSSAISYLLSKDADSVTGTTLTVDAGSTA